MAVSATASQCWISRFTAYFAQQGFMVLQHLKCEGKIKGLQKNSNQQYSEE
jgi:hypothetical protein